MDAVCQTLLQFMLEHSEWSGTLSGQMQSFPLQIMLEEMGIRLPDAHAS